MAKLKYYLDKRNKGFRSESPLKLAIRHKRASAYISLGIELLPSHWDDRTEKVIVHPRRASYNAHIAQIRLDVQEIILRLVQSGRIESMTATEIKRYVEKSIHSTDEDDSGTFIATFRKFINEKKKPRTKEIYEYTLSRMMKYCPDVEIMSFDGITREWLTGFESFLAKTSPSQNARNIHLRNIRAVFNYAIDEEITSCYPFRRFKIRPVETPKRSLTVEQLREVFNYPVEEYQRKYLDAFKLIFYLIGINVVDLCRLEGIQAGRIEYHRAKTGRLYSIKAEPEAIEIIEKYKGEKYLLDILDRYEDHKDYMKRLNDNLKSIGEVKHVGAFGKKIIKPLFPKLTTYWARHTWASIAASLDIPKETISAALGHEIGSRVTSIYINFDHKKVDEANRKVIDYVLYGKR